MILKPIFVLSLNFLIILGIVSASSKYLTQAKVAVSSEQLKITDSSTTEVYYEDDVDIAIVNFLTHSMQNYKQWLAMRDPLSPIPDVVTLDSNDLPDYQKPDMDVVMKISNQYMTNHSKYDQADFPEESDINTKLIQVHRIMVEDDHNVTFSGDYSASGILKVSPNLEVNFSGEGQWYIKGSRIRELLFYVLFKINENGYIDLSTSEHKAYSYSAWWQEWDFTGLKITYGGEVNPEWEELIKENLRKMYALYLSEAFKISDYCPPKKLLDTYLQERFMSTKLVDIASDWQTMPTTPTTTTTPSTTTPSSSQGRINGIFGHRWIFILTFITLCSTH